MKQITLDFESFYDADYSLRNMTPVEYILDPRFELIGCAVKEGSAPAFWLTEPELVAYLARLPADIVIISHNALFDMCLLAWRFDYVPALMIDTMGLARAWYGHKLRSVALSMVAAFLGLGAKGTTVHKVQGMGLAAIKTAGFYDEYVQYSLNDAELCWLIYRKIVDEGFPPAEIMVMDTVLRCAVLPKFVLNQTLLAEHLHATVQSKAELLAKCGIADKSELMSNDKFAEALRGLGVEPPRKISLTTGNETYAFAKTDHEFIDLEEHDNPEVQALVAARLGIKSTLEETRTVRLMSIANLTWRGNLGGKVGLLPVPLRYSGAHTHRLSGDWKLNLQNLPARSNNKLRMAIEAPAGRKVIAVDSSQIEARISSWFSGEWGMVRQFANKEDVYSTFATSVFGYPVLKKSHPVERFLGKTAVLGLGYNMGWPKFQGSVAIASKSQLGEELKISDEDAAKIVKTYRTTYRAIPAMWQLLQGLIPQMTGRGFEYELGPIKVYHQRILLPSGLSLHYHDLQNVDGDWMFTYGGKPGKIYGGKMLENITQALARIVVMDAAVRIRRKIKLDLALQIHDELLYVVPNAQVETIEGIIREEMSVPPSWGLDIPLDAEGAFGQSYGDAK